MSQTSQSKGNQRPCVKPYTRQLKVYYAYESGKFHIPFICLSGKWVKDAGFDVGSIICVTVKKNQLIIKPVK